MTAYIVSHGHSGNPERWFGDITELSLGANQAAWLLVWASLFTGFVTWASHSPSLSFPFLIY